MTGRADGAPNQEPGTVPVRAPPGLAYFGSEACNVATSVDASPSDASPPAAISWGDVAAVPRPCAAVVCGGLPCHGCHTKRVTSTATARAPPTPARMLPDRVLTKAPRSGALSRHRRSQTGRHLGGVGG